MFGGTTVSHGVRGRTGGAEIDATTARHVADTMQALSSPTRVRILARLRESPCSVNELADAVAMEQSAVSHHLRLLRHLGLVVGERDGRRTIYGLHDEHVGVLGRGRIPRPARAAWLRRPAPARSTSFMSQRDAKGEGREATESGHHDHDHDHSHAHAHAHGHGHPHTHAPGEHGHSHGLVDRSIIRSRAGIKAVSLSLGVLMATALAQAAIFAFSDSVALLADLIHNVGDALTAVPLGIAFFLFAVRRSPGWWSSP